MRRRNFLITLSGLGTSVRASAAKSLKSIPVPENAEALNSLGARIKAKLFRKKTYDLVLPENPVPIESVVTVVVKGERKEALPKVISKTKNIQGSSEKVILKEPKEYTLQFINDQMGWIIS